VNSRGSSHFLRNPQIRRITSFVTKTHFHAFSLVWMNCCVPLRNRREHDVIAIPSVPPRPARAAGWCLLREGFHELSWIVGKRPNASFPFPCGELPPLPSDSRKCCWSSLSRADSAIPWRNRRLRQLPSLCANPLDPDPRSWIGHAADGICRRARNEGKSIEAALLRREAPKHNFFRFCRKRCCGCRDRDATSGTADHTPRHGGRRPRVIDYHGPPAPPGPPGPRSPGGGMQPALALAH